MDTGTPDHPRMVTLTVLVPAGHHDVPDRPIEVQTHDGDTDAMCAPLRYYTAREALALANALTAAAAAATVGGTYLGVLNLQPPAP